MAFLSNVEQFKKFSAVVSNPPTVVKVADVLTRWQLPNKKDSWLFSRSGILTWTKCQREYYLSQLKDGMGISLAIPNLDLVLGSGLHAGVQHLLTKALERQTAKLPVTIDRSDYDQAEKICLNYFTDSFKTAYRFTKYSEETSQQIYAIAKWVLEGMLYCWFKYEYPELLRSYEIVAVEKSIGIKLSLAKVIPKPAKDTAVFLSKADAILKDKEFGNVTIYSLKTTGATDARVKDSFKHDLQGYTEVTTWNKFALLNNSTVEFIKVAAMQFCNNDKAKAVELLRELNNQLMPKLTFKLLPDSASAVRTCSVLKGKFDEKRYNLDGEWVSHWETSSPLYWGYRRVTPLGDVEWKWLNKIPNPDNSSGFGYLGKAYQRVALPQVFNSPKEWVDLIDQQGIQADIRKFSSEIIDVYPPKHILASRQSESYVQIASYAKQITPSEQAYNILADERNPNYLTVLDSTYPQSGNCVFPTRCQFYFYCHEKSEMQSWQETGIYIKRQPHHELEEELLNA